MYTSGLDGLDDFFKDETLKKFAGRVATGPAMKSQVSFLASP